MSQPSSMSDDQLLDGTWARLSQVAVKGAQYNSPERHPHPKCLEGTRVDLLKYIHECLDNPDQNQIIWLHGTAGVGKSSVAFTVAEKMRSLKVTEETNVEKRLGGTFFFSREKTERRTASYFFATLVYQLATNFPSIRKDVNRVIRDNPALLDPNTPLCDQMEALFLKPLRWLRPRLRGCLPLSFIVDALDECTSEPELTDLILSLARSLRDPDLPVTHILLTSRSESHISKVFQNDEVRPLVREIPVRTSGEGNIISLDGTDVDNDICTFLQYSFRELGSRHPDFSQPSKDDLAKLASRAGRRFIVASTMMKFIIDDEDNDPRDRVQLMLELTSELLPGTEVYKLYDCILSTCTDPKRAYLHLSLVAALTDPLPISQISTLLGPGLGRDVQTTLTQLRSFMDIPADSTLLVNIYHSSIRDYVSDPSNCGLPQVRNIASPHCLLARSSLRLMNEIPESTALLNALSELKKQSEAMQPEDPHKLKDSLAFLVEPLEPLSAIICMLWLRGDHTSDLHPWLGTVSGRAWLQIQAGRNWLQTQGGRDWLQIPIGQEWLAHEGQEWLRTHEGQEWLRTQGAREWLQTQGAREWLQTQAGREWLQIQAGRGWLQTQAGREWLRTEGGRKWLQTLAGREWLQTLEGRGWLQTLKGQWLWTEGERKWLQTLEGREWLQTPEGREWLQTLAGREWLQTLAGREWVQTRAGREWLQTEGGQKWLQTLEGREWLQTLEGREWLQTPEGRDWQQAQARRDWLQTQAGYEWLQTQAGREWLQTRAGQDWLQIKRGQEWLQTRGGREWLQTWGGQEWLQTWDGREWPSTRGGREWLLTQRGQEWLQTWGGREWLQTWGGQEWLSTQRGRDWLQTQGGRDWLQTKEGRDWLPTLAGRDWLQTQEARDWLQTQEARDWLWTQGGRDWLWTRGVRVSLPTQEMQVSLLTQEMRESLQIQEVRESLLIQESLQSQAWLRTDGGRDWLQTEGGRGWLQTLAGREWLHTQGGREWLQTQGGREWLQTVGGQGWLQTLTGREWPQTQGGRDWLQTQGGRDWLQTQEGRDWLRTPHGEAWQSTPAASVWVTVEEFLRTSEAMSEYIIPGDVPLLPAFQVIQLFKILPDFLMFPIFLSLRHHHHSTSAISEGLPLPDREIIHAMDAFKSFANDALERSRTASDALKYACHNWAVHLSRTPNPWDDTLNYIFQAFRNNHMIPWLEMEWCLKGLRFCLLILSEGQKIVKSMT